MANDRHTSIPDSPTSAAASATSATFALRRVTQCEGCEFPTADLDAYEARLITVDWVLCGYHQRESHLLQAGSNGALEATGGFHYF
ncbi:hypothetical protein ABT263_38495 [Kitasatospora sp. NPDC001603]|uniref:hypothetical protein n=1 Tax=Kitasatospora sp. NPDC001603 TaxID=3154388 RepID=UPI003327241E